MNYDAPFLGPNSYELNFEAINDPSNYYHYPHGQIH